MERTQKYMHTKRFQGFNMSGRRSVASFLRRHLNPSSHTANVPRSAVTTPRARNWLRWKQLGKNMRDSTVRNQSDTSAASSPKKIKKGSHILIRLRYGFPFLVVLEILILAPQHPRESPVPLFQRHEAFPCDLVVRRILPFGRRSLPG